MILNIKQRGGRGSLIRMPFKMHPLRRGHDSFFSSLSQVEKRLASEEEEELEKPQPPSCSPIPSLPSSSPLFLSDNPIPIHQPSANTATSSGPPLEFLSNSPTPQIQQQLVGQPDRNEDDIDTLISLLGLSFPICERDTSPSSCHCSGSSEGGGFFRRVVGVKGPRCGKEMERLDAWIHALYSSSRKKREPARLAHLLLGKAVALTVGSGSGGGYGLGEVGFLETVEDFLEHDPPETVPQHVGLLHNLSEENN